jgi:hypothetical protein
VKASDCTTWLGSEANGQVEFRATGPPSDGLKKEKLATRSPGQGAGAAVE